MSRPALVRLLFVCIGNSCRSPMAEAFANYLGAGLVEASSAGLFPAPVVQPLTLEAMAERDVPVENKPPRSVLYVDWASFDLVVNMSQMALGGVMLRFTGREINWEVHDPIGFGIEVYREVRDQIEHLVTDLIEELRQDISAADARR
ncbi:MAG: hypothetical protein HY236_05650 [Acidobacteria bacterium]|nr:hypothetical protein [Acidobacteriota bacterium]